jgi:hypothetical protein
MRSGEIRVREKAKIVPITEIELKKERKSSFKGTYDKLVEQPSEARRGLEKLGLKTDLPWRGKM